MISTALLALLATLAGLLLGCGSLLLACCLVRTVAAGLAGLLSGRVL